MPRKSKWQEEETPEEIEETEEVAEAPRKAREPRIAIPAGQMYPTTLYHPEKPARHIKSPAEYRDAIKEGWKDLKDMADDDRKAAWLRETSGLTHPSGR